MYRWIDSDNSLTNKTTAKYFGLVTIHRSENWQPPAWHNPFGTIRLAQPRIEQVPNIEKKYYI